MTCRRRPTWFICGVLVVGLSAGAVAAELPQLIEKVKAVGPESKNAAGAQAALAELSAGKPATILPLLAALDGATPVAANYLRSAVETIAQRTIDQGNKLPAREIEQFLRETKHDPRARRLAFELLTRVDNTAADRLIPGMLDDPSVELRRDAVARLIAQAAEDRKAERNDEARRAFARALNSARDDDQVQAIKKQLEELGEKVDLPSHFGFLLSWKLVSPFDNTGKKGFNVAYPPEKAVDFAAEYDGKEGKKIGWSEYTTDNEYGIVDLAKTLSPFKGAITYAAAEFVSDKQQTVDFRLGTPNSWKLWLNGELLFAREEYHRGMNLDQYRVRGTLKPGRNTILLKVCQNEQTEPWAQRWQFQLRICDATGTAVLSADRGKKRQAGAAGSD